MRERPVIRRLHPSDSIEGLTELLHRAYGALAARGFRYLASWQDSDTTRRRIEGCECFVALLGDRVVGTITFCDATQTTGERWYERDGVASFQQFAVEPELQRAGIGSALLDTVERRARETGAVELACDTADGAADLIAFYARRGYREVARVDWEITNYESVVLSKTL